MGLLISFLLNNENVLNLIIRACTIHYTGWKFIKDLVLLITLSSVVLCDEAVQAILSDSENDENLQFYWVCIMTVESVGFWLRRNPYVFREIFRVQNLLQFFIISTIPLQEIKKKQRRRWCFLLLVTIATPFHSTSLHSIPENYYYLLIQV